MTSKQDTVLITGGLGQVGYYLYQILKDSYKICILDNGSKAKFQPSNDVIFIKGDIRDETIYTKLPNVNYIIHCAAQISIEGSVANPIRDAQINILGTLKLLEYAKTTSLKKLIYLSSAATIGDPIFLPITEDHPRNPISPYGYSKYVAEKYVLLYSDLYKINSVVLIPFNLYSPLQEEDDPYAGVVYKFITAVLNDSPPLIEGDGKQTRDFIHAKDLALAIKLVIEKGPLPQRVYNIGSGEGTSINDLANLIIKISGKTLTPVHVEPRTVDIKDSYCSIDAARKILDFNPSISLEDGIRELYNYIKSKNSS